ncbi:Rpn family recombination-promoting nuclease/putative transposase [Pantoea ananatis]|uniref:Rpn family recombination-promoting nuclease/putative transposase n=1 Tax=Pantoea ananas TaxID=553 RepID=UPI000CF4CBB7|nr:Rpn family recombination-promoting nuclease/putative transposase [Pantoea ananatis]MBA4822666.1 Rpn family recombination-promoting nuclease/putative transposase [Pantoea ananatis]MCW1832935.1 Rpn family recombination-promoting nuclease/putative transposase [Pantoea ananatis]MDF7791969.1 Rpn family recombination-promoting nuclease/putative transposase [Pantoea ananatis]MDI6538943.1 Rpn family recombination-promoting nuclease/putative transposase [Pantoea ananatis]PQK98741.1 ISNCY family tran
MKSKNGTPTPHDATFRQFLSQPTIARDFMALHLPAEFLALCDLDTLKLESGAFVEEDLRQYFSDILYSLKTTSRDDGYIHVLIEHQSSPDRHMAFRLMRYAIAAMQRHLDAGHKKLPLVIPILFYSGKRSPYPYSTRWLDEFSIPAFASRLYSNAFPLVDVTVIPDEEIVGHRSMAALTLLQKHIHQRDLAELIDKLAPVTLADYLSSSQVISLVNYLLQAGETADADLFVRTLAQRVPQHEDALMTIAQQLEQKGIEKGLEEGLQLGEQRGLVKGRSEGERSAALKIARTMLQNGLPPSLVAEMTGLSDDDLAQIAH